MPRRVDTLVRPHLGTLAIPSGQRRAAAHHRLLARFEGERVLGYALLLPAIIYIALLIGYPFVLAVWIALTNQTVGSANPKFVGFDNFAWAWENSIFQTALRNTLLLTFGTELVKMLLGTTLAFLLVRPFRGRGVARALIIIPWAIPIAISVIAWRWMFDSQYSVINWVLVHAGLISASAKPNYLGDPNLALWSVAAVNVWRGVPFSAIIVMAGLTSIPQDLLEAAHLDGASFLQRWRMVIVPIIAPILFIALAQLPARSASEAQAKSGHDIFGWFAQGGPRLYDDLLVDLSDVVKQVGEKNGGWDRSAEDLCLVEGKWKGMPDFLVPFLSSYRKDAWTTAGLPNGPDTWDDLLKGG